MPAIETKTLRYIIMPIAFDHLSEPRIRAIELGIMTLIHPSRIPSCAYRIIHRTRRNNPPSPSRKSSASPYLHPYRVSRLLPTSRCYEPPRPGKSRHIALSPEHCRASVTSPPYMAAGSPAGTEHESKPRLKPLLSINNRHW